MLQTQLRTSAAFRAPTAGQVSVAVSIVDEHGDHVPLDGWTDPTVAGTIPASAVVVPPPADDDQDDVVELEESGYIRITTDDPLTLEQAGLHQLHVTVTDPNGGTHQLQPVGLVVESDDGWHTTGSAREAWADAPTRDGVLWELLDAARAQCLAYAPLEDADVPAGHRQAQLNVARAIWARAKSGAGDDSLGMDAYAVRVYVDDPDTRRLLRPRRIRGGIA